MMIWLTSFGYLFASCLRWYYVTVKSATTAINIQQAQFPHSWTSISLLFNSLQLPHSWTKIMCPSDYPCWVLRDGKFRPVSHETGIQENRTAMVSPFQVILAWNLCRVRWFYRLKLNLTSWVCGSFITTKHATSISCTMFVRFYGTINWYLTSSAKGGTCTDQL